VLALTLVLKHASGLDEAARATLAAAAGAPPASGPRSQRARPRALITLVLMGFLAP
jgi:hypothetical protein